MSNNAFHFKLRLNHLFVTLVGTYYLHSGCTSHIVIRLVNGPKHIILTTLRYIVRHPIGY